MKILILGAGRVGRSVAESLVSDANDITIVDESSERVNLMQERFDLLGLVGNASSPSVLSSAGAMDTDLLIAVTASDETNLVACTLAAQLFNIPMRIARVRNSELRHYPRILGEEGFRATSIIWPEQAIASHLAKLITFPAAQQVLSFADGLLTLFTVRATAGASLVGRPLREIFIQLPDAQVRFVSIFRRNHRLECRSDTVIESGDEVTVLTASHCADSVIGTLRPYEMAQTVVLMNGGNLSGLVTDELEPNRSNVESRSWRPTKPLPRNFLNDMREIACPFRWLKQTIPWLYLKKALGRLMWFYHCPVTTKPTLCQPF